MGEKNDHQEAQAMADAERDIQAASEAMQAPEGDLGEPGAEELDPIAALAMDLKTVHAEKEELQNQMLLLAADMENLRKRTRKDVSDAREFSIAGFARDLLSVTDNLRRALDAIPGDAAANDTDSMKTLVDGVELTERELLNALEKHGVKKISPAGEKFDPNYHQAMFEVPNAEVPNKTVMEVVQDGYVIGTRMLRPAMVGVSKGGPKAAATEATPESSEEAE